MRTRPLGRLAMTLLSTTKFAPWAWVAWVRRVYRSYFWVKPTMLRPSNPGKVANPVSSGNPKIVGSIRPVVSGLTPAIPSLGPGKPRFGSMPCSNFSFVSPETNAEISNPVPSASSKPQVSRSPPVACSSPVMSSVVRTGNSGRLSTVVTRSAPVPGLSSSDRNGYGKTRGSSLNSSTPGGSWVNTSPMLLSGISMSLSVCVPPTNRLLSGRNVGAVGNQIWLSSSGMIGEPIRSLSDPEKRNQTPSTVPR